MLPPPPPASDAAPLPQRLRLRAACLTPHAAWRASAGGYEPSSRGGDRGALDLDAAAVAHLMPDLDGPGAPEPAAQALLQRHYMGGAKTSHARLSSGSAHEGPVAGTPTKAARTRLTASGDEELFAALGALEPGGGPGLGLGGGPAAAALGSSGSDGDLAAAALLADHPPAEAPSRTLLVRGLAPELSDDDTAALLSSHGDLRTVYTAAKRHGLVVVTYYDLRAAVRAAQALRGLQAAGLGGAALEVHYTAPQDKQEVGLNQVGGSLRPRGQWRPAAGGGGGRQLVAAMARARGWHAGANLPQPVVQGRAARRCPPPPPAATARQSLKVSCSHSAGHHCGVQPGPKLNQ
jgi:hypothetical protein